MEKLMEIQAQRSGVGITEMRERVRNLRRYEHSLQRRRDHYFSNSPISAAVPTPINSLQQNLAAG